MAALPAPDGQDYPRNRHGLLVGHYFVPDDLLLFSLLDKKIHGRRLPRGFYKIFHDIPILDFHPSELYAKYREDKEDGYIYFLSARKFPTPSGNKNRPVRMAKGGAWKASGGGKTVKSQNVGGVDVGQKLIMVFYERRNGGNKEPVKTTWGMQEFTKIIGPQKKVADLALYRLYKIKNNGDVEDTDDDDAVDAADAAPPSVDTLALALPPPGIAGGSTMLMDPTNVSSTSQSQVFAPPQSNSLAIEQDWLQGAHGAAALAPAPEPEPTIWGSPFGPEPISWALPDTPANYSYFASMDPSSLLDPLVPDAANPPEQKVPIHNITGHADSAGAGLTSSPADCEMWMLEEDADSADAGLTSSAADCDLWLLEEDADCNLADVDIPEQQAVLKEMDGDAAMACDDPIMQCDEQHTSSAAPPAAEFDLWPLDEDADDCYFVDTDSQQLQAMWIETDGDDRIMQCDEQHTSSAAAALSTVVPAEDNGLLNLMTDDDDFMIQFDDSFEVSFKDFCAQPIDETAGAPMLTEEDGRGAADDGGNNGGSQPQDGHGSGSQN
ncbi:hypothetical protein ABZP36_028935 [Zizania latifolia]